MFAKAADSGHTLSQLELGHHYFKGLGVIQSNEKALKLYRQAAENGNANASFNIGLMYWKGEGVETDLIPTCTDQHSCAHLRIPMDLMRAGWAISLFQASQQ